MDVMLLGTYHMNNSRNQFTPSDDMVLEPRQQEILGVVEQLARFRPTKIAVERLTIDQALLDQQYRHFLGGTWPLPPRECYQLGFRLAQRLAHQGVYAIDWKNERDDLDIGDVFAFAEQHMPTLYKKLNHVGESFIRDLETKLQNEGLSRILCWINEPAVLRASHQIYLWMTAIDDGAHRLGLDWVSDWYARNLAIYANLMQQSREDDRWLVIYGSGHVPLLRQFLQDSGQATLVPVQEFL